MVDRTGESSAVMHAALLALHDPMKELDRRIWSGQVATLLPYIEERRRQILNEVRPLLRMPIKFPDGQVIHEIFDLEIGQIYRQVSQNGLRISPTTRTELYRLTEMRNRLAHLQLLQPEDIGT